MVIEGHTHRVHNQTNHSLRQFHGKYTEEKYLYKIILYQINCTQTSSQDSRNKGNYPHLLYGSVNLMPAIRVGAGVWLESRTTHKILHSLCRATVNVNCTFGKYLLGIMFFVDIRGQSWRTKAYYRLWV